MRIKHDSFYYEVTQNPDGTYGILTHPCWNTTTLPVRVDDKSSWESREDACDALRSFIKQMESYRYVYGQVESNGQRYAVTIDVIMLDGQVPNTGDLKGTPVIKRNDGIWLPAPGYEEDIASTLEDYNEDDYL